MDEFYNTNSFKPFLNIKNMEYSIFGKIFGKKSQESERCYLNSDRKCNQVYDCAKQGQRNSNSRAEELSEDGGTSNPFGEFTSLNSVRSSPVVCLEALPKNVRRVLNKGNN